MARPISLAYPSTGVFMSDAPALVSQTAWATGQSSIYGATNLRVEDRRWKTREGWEELTPVNVPDVWHGTDTQGAIYHDPPGDIPPCIVESASGQLWRITPSDRTFTVEDISSGRRGTADERLAWLASGDKYVIRTERNAPTQIWDGTQTTFSAGYNPNQPDTSGLPNFAGPVTFTDRFWIVYNGREIIAGDFAHRTVATDTSDLIRTKDNAYDITSISFPPPAPMGDVKALFTVTTTRGGGLPSQGEVIAATVNPGLWGILAGIPRAQWADTQMRRIVMERTCPTGPYAAISLSSELLFRSNDGFSSIKYADQEKSAPGNPMVNVGQEIKVLLDNDHDPDLLYASAVSAYGRQRFACTVAPEVRSAARWHRGYVSAALQPGRTRVPEALVWEGVSVLPERMGKIVQFVLFGTRIFALTLKPDGTKGLAEWTTAPYDRLADGTCLPIRWQILTRRLAVDFWHPASFPQLLLRLSEFRESVSAEIHVRTDRSPQFRKIGEENWCNEGWVTQGGYGDTGPVPFRSGVQAGEIQGGWVQFLVKGVGACTLEMAASEPSEKSPPDVKQPVASGFDTCNFFDP